MLVEVILIELSKLKVEFANNGRFDPVFVFKENKLLFNNIVDCIEIETDIIMQEVFDDIIVA